MGKKSIWTEETQVNTYETDFQQHWKPANYFKAMVDAASKHAGSLGFDYKNMLEQEIVWVLSRVKIYFYHPPVTGDPITIRTWPKGIQQRLFFMRDFQFMGENGNPIATATTAWLLINTRARRILPPQTLPGDLPDNDGLFALDEKLEKVASVDNLPEQFVTQATYSAIDLMGHVNNTRYIEWICDCFPFEQYREQRLKWLQINYINEIKPGERVSIAAGTQPEDPLVWLIQGTNLDTGVKAFEAALCWSSES